MTEEERLDSLLDMISNLHKSIIVETGKKVTTYSFRDLKAGSDKSGDTIREYIEQINEFGGQDTKALSEMMIAVQQGFRNGEDEKKLSPIIEAIAGECERLSKEVSKKLNPSKEEKEVDEPSFNSLGQKSNKSFISERREAKSYVGESEAKREEEPNKRSHSK